MTTIGLDKMPLEQVVKHWERYHVPTILAYLTNQSYTVCEVGKALKKLQALNDKSLRPEISQVQQVLDNGEKTLKYYLYVLDKLGCSVA